jgi:Rod binding domain-containing protein
MNISSDLSTIVPGAGTTSTVSKSSKIHDAAQQFEALLVGEMLKSARESGSWGLTDEESDPGQDTFSGMAESQFANALAKSGGLGLSRVVEQSVSHQAGTAQKE